MKTELKKFIFCSLKNAHQCPHAVNKGLALIHQTMALCWSRQLCAWSTFWRH